MSGRAGAAALAVQCVRERWLMFVGDANALGLYDALVQVCVAAAVLCACDHEH